MRRVSSRELYHKPETKRMIGAKLHEAGAPRK